MIGELLPLVGFRGNKATERLGANGDMKKGGQEWGLLKKIIIIQI